MIVYSLLLIVIIDICINIITNDASNSTTFQYTGSYQTFNVPHKFKWLLVELYGGGGGGSSSGGGLMLCNISVEPNTVLYILVGGQGAGGGGVTAYNGGNYGGIGVSVVGSGGINDI